MVVLAVLACRQPDGAAARVECAGCSWELLGAHPQASAQPTATGRALVTLCPWRGRLYIGYGDYQANTGPIDVTAWDPERRDFTTLHTSDTEAIASYRVIGGSLYAPATDRRDNADYAVGEPWRDRKPVTTAHAYDMATLDGSDLWLVGAAELGVYSATAWRSTDGGTRWAVARASTESGRYYFAAVYHQELYLQGWSMTAMQPMERSEVFDGTHWRDGPNLLPVRGHGFRPITFVGRLVYATKQTIDAPHSRLAATPNLLLGFDGSTASVVFDREVLDFFANEHDLVVLDPEGLIWRTRDLVIWTRVAIATDLQPRSVALMDDVLYVGTKDAKLYRLTGGPRA